jgi:hypothetical protein
MGHVDLGFDLEQLAGEMGRRAVAAGAEAELSEARAPTNVRTKGTSYEGRAAMLVGTSSSPH